MSCPHCDASFSGHDAFDPHAPGRYARLQAEVAADERRANDARGTRKTRVTKKTRQPPRSALAIEQLLQGVITVPRSPMSIEQATSILVGVLSLFKVVPWLGAVPGIALAIAVELLPEKSGE